MLGHMHMEQQSSDSFKEVSILPLSNSILSRSVNTRSLMKDAMLKHEGLKIVLKHILLHYDFSDFDQKHEIEYESLHRRHGNEKTTQSGFSLNITKWCVNNHQQK